MHDRNTRLQMLRATRAGIERDLATLCRRWKAAERAAEEWAKDLEPGRGSFFGRGATTWTVRQERWFQERLRQLAAAETGNVRALLARVTRCRQQEMAQAARLRLNEPWRPDLSAVQLWTLLLDHDQGPIRNGMGQRTAELASPRNPPW